MPCQDVRANILLKVENNLKIPHQLTCSLINHADPLWQNLGE